MRPKYRLLGIAFRLVSISFRDWGLLCFGTVFHLENTLARQILCLYLFTLRPVYMSLRGREEDDGQRYYGAEGCVIIS